MNKLIVCLITSVICFQLQAMDKADSQNGIEGNLSFAWVSETEEFNGMGIPYLITTLEKLKHAEANEVEKLKRLGFEKNHTLVSVNIFSNDGRNLTKIATKTLNNPDGLILPSHLSFKLIQNLQEGQKIILSAGNDSIELTAKQLHSIGHDNGSPETFQAAAARIGQYVKFLAAEEGKEENSQFQTNRFKKFAYFGLAGIGLVAGYFAAKYFGFNLLSFFKI